MFKRIFVTLSVFMLSLLTTGLVYAGNLSIRIEAPKTPTNQNTFKINFVSMDISGGAIEVKCFKKGPGDGVFSQFGSTINLTAGGNSGNCEVNSSIVSGEGIYEFKAEATTSDSGTVPSSIVNVKYKNSGPGTPGDYKKELQGSCQYKISFKTSNDGGTSRVEVYRSDQTSFTADGGTRVGTVWVGPNEVGSLIDTPPDCGKTYYYVIRAFDGAGNGSGITGDSVTKVTTTTTTVAISPSPGQGAIPVLAAAGTTSLGTGGQILGEEKAATEEGETQGEATSEATLEVTQTPTGGAGGIFGGSFLKWFALLLLVIGGYYLYQRSKKQS